jgi:hypothetical protein
VDCNGIVNSVDSLKVSRHAAGLSVSQTEPCPNIGSGVLAGGQKQGDIDCNNTVNSVDALKLKRYVAGLAYSQNEPCPDIGAK